MIVSINPAGCRNQKPRLLISRILFVLGQIVSANIFGIIVLTIGTYTISVVPGMNTIILICITISSILFMLHEYNVIRIKYPQRRSQVNKGWRNYPIYKKSLLFGLYLGSGVLTFIRTPAYHIMIMLILYLNNLGYTLLIMTIYSISKSIPVLAVPFNGNSEDYAETHMLLENKWKVVTGNILFIVSIFSICLTYQSI